MIYKNTDFNKLPDALELRRILNIFQDRFPVKHLMPSESIVDGAEDKYLLTQLSGKQLIDDGCLAFVGFNNESQVLCDSDYANVIMNCDQACLFAFLNDNVNLKDALKLAIAYYDTQIENCSRNNNIMLQSILIANREALCMYGDETLTRNDFNH